MFDESSSFDNFIYTFFAMPFSSPQIHTRYSNQYND